MSAASDPPLGATRALEGPDLAGGWKFFSDAPARAHWRAPRGRLFDLEVNAAEPGAWMALHLPLGPLPLEDAGVLALFVRAAAPGPVVIRPCLRSGDGEGFEDCFFPLQMAAHAAASDHLDALVPGRSFRLPVTALWRELVLFLPVRPLRLTLLDARVLAG